MYIRQDRIRPFWRRNPYLKFIVAQNLIKKDLDIHFFYLREMLRNWGQFSNTAIVQRYFKYKKCLILETRAHLKKVCFLCYSTLYSDSKL